MPNVNACIRRLERQARSGRGGVVPRGPRRDGAHRRKWIEKESSAVTGKAKSYSPVVIVGLGALVVVVVAVLAEPRALGDVDTEAIDQLAPSHSHVSSNVEPPYDSPPNRTIFPATVPAIAPDRAGG